MTYGKFSEAFLVAFLIVNVLTGNNPALAQNKSVKKQSAAKQLHDLFEAEWEWSMRENPTWASHLGDLRYNDRWSDESFEAIKRRQRHRQVVIEKLSMIAADDLSAPDKINFSLFRREYRMAEEGDQHQWYLLPLTMRDGIQDAGSTADSLRFKTVKDYQDWIARIQAFPVYMDQTLELMKRGIQKKTTASEGGDETCPVTNSPPNCHRPRKESVLQTVSQIPRGLFVRRSQQAD